MSRQLQERRAGGREFRILGDVTEKLQIPNDVRANGTEDTVHDVDQRSFG